MSIFLDSPLVCPVVIGRTDYLLALDQYIKSAAAGISHTLLLKGEAGVGKSRLVAEAQTRALQAGLQSGQGQCFEYQPSPPFAPVIEILHNLLTSQWAGQTKRLLDSSSPGGYRALARLLPELLPVSPGTEPLPPVDPEQEKHLIFNILFQFFVRLATEQPLLLICEDLHWCDETSLEFLLQLARRIVIRPVLILLTYRSDEVNPILGHFLAELDRARLATEITLLPFSRVETGQMLQKLLELPQPVRNDFLNPIFDLTEGNPFFIEEVLRSLITNGDIYRSNNRWERKPLSELHIPRSIQDTIQRRTLHLTEPARKLLHLAAAIGRQFDFKLLLKSSGQEGEALIGQLKEILAVQLLKEEDNEQLAFRHALARQAIYAALINPERKVLHARIGQTIEQLYAGKAEEHLTELAYHFYQAGQWQKAYDYALQSGQSILAVHAPSALIENLNRAVEVAGYLKIVPPSWLYKTRGQAYEVKGGFEAANQDFTQVLDLARQNGDTQAEWQSLIDLGFLWAGHNYEQTGQFFQQAYGLAQNLNDATLEARSLNRLGNWYSNTGQIEESLAVHYQALAIFESLGDKPGLAETHDLLCMTNGLIGNLSKSIEHAEPAIALGRELGDERILVSSFSEYALALSNTHTIDLVMLEPGLAKNYDLACSIFDEGLQLARQKEWLAGQAYLLYNMCLMGIFNGEVEKSLEYGQQALQIATEIEHQQWTIAAYQSLGITNFYLLQLEVAQEYLEKALALADELGSSYWSGNVATGLVLVYLYQGNISGAEKTLARQDLLKLIPRHQGERWVTLAAGKLALAQGQPQVTLEIIDRIIASFPNPDLEQPGPETLKVKAEALMASGQWEEARATLAMAKQLIEKWQVVPLHWEIHILLHLIYSQLNQTEAARLEVGTARRFIHRFADVLKDSDLRQHFLRAALAKLPARKPLSARQSKRLDYEGLTIREQEVATQIALGKTNREIGQILTLSERTIEAHVGRILAKLDFNSRYQVAAWAVEKGLSAN